MKTFSVCPAQFVCWKTRSDRWSKWSQFKWNNSRWTWFSLTGEKGSCGDLVFSLQSAQCKSAYLSIIRSSRSSLHENMPFSLRSSSVWVTYCSWGQDLKKYCLFKVIASLPLLSAQIYIHHRKVLLFSAWILLVIGITVLMGICKLRTTRINMPSAIFSDNLLHVSNVSFPECKACINCTSYANILHHIFYFQFYDYKQLHKHQVQCKSSWIKACMPNAWILMFTTRLTCKC